MGPIQDACIARVESVQAPDLLNVHTVLALELVDEGLESRLPDLPWREVTPRPSVHYLFT